jgi:hypothetical protein
LNVTLYNKTDGENARLSMEEGECIGCRKQRFISRSGLCLTCAAKEAIMQTETTVRPNGGAKRPRLGTEGAIKLGAVRGSIDELVELFVKSQAAAEDFSSTIKAVAEHSGIVPSVLRKFVKARAGDKFAKAREEVKQMALVFEEC